MESKRGSMEAFGAWVNPIVTRTVLWLRNLFVHTPCLARSALLTLTLLPPPSLSLSLSLSAFLLLPAGRTAAAVPAWLHAPLL
ncbi:predicted protein [Plenodomus lingam JN3]|uniref:Predicted protein n=1 Tax=Leptosphaeria maculans (strain JN3 / isolate v23.1.3 / race Av1-4-5-6-7-8) TaxID=985895 RepID=E5AB49_LEPMJ|nr:predicted protein [Plenodomus lingam JN3]CBY00890.1 predicted protein [Plenodomus lingam JN3]